MTSIVIAKEVQYHRKRLTSRSGIIVTEQGNVCRESPTFAKNT